MENLQSLLADRNTLVEIAYVSNRRKRIWLTSVIRTEAEAEKEKKLTVPSAYVSFDVTLLLASPFLFFVFWVVFFYFDRDIRRHLPPFLLTSLVKTSLRVSFLSVVF